MTYEQDLPSHNKEKGQLIIEGVLLMVLFLGLAILLKKEFNDRKIIDRLLSGPWKSVAKMAQQGNWDKSKSEDEVHPQAQIQTREGDK